VGGLFELLGGFGLLFGHASQMRVLALGFKKG
jgi:uncharacterized membrane protein